MGAPMLTVGNNTAGVEELLGNGLLSCPGCGGRLGGWGHAARRPVFTAGRVPGAGRARRAGGGGGGAGVPEGAVRGRLRRFRASAGRVREFFTRLAGVLAVDPVPLDPAGSPLAD